MEHDSQSNSRDESASNPNVIPAPYNEPVQTFESPRDLPLAPPESNFIQQVFIGSKGLRAGWSIALFVILLTLIGAAVGYMFSLLHLSTRSTQFTVRRAFVGELSGLLTLIGATWTVALIERRSLFDFNLNDTRRAANFCSGVSAGFLALSVLVGGLWSGGWLRFGTLALSGSNIAKYAALWGLTFLLVGFVEEGMFRCYLQFTLTRAINFWWAVGIQAAVCVYLVLRTKGTAAWGIYAMVLLGLLPCLMLQLKRAPHSSFWQAAWVTSTLFGFIHVGNNGENWIGIFAAAVIGFVFCVSVWLTGSAWWAIGCHAGWDWGETYFYGTADSGLVAPGHYLSTSPYGNAFWSGGSDGPEGSILVLGAILLLLLALLVIYRRGPVIPAQAGEEQTH
jgi:membrane protease YdiL (CAAX protease family)